MRLKTIATALTLLSVLLAGSALAWEHLNRWDPFYGSRQRSVVADGDVKIAVSRISGETRVELIRESYEKCADIGETTTIYYTREGMDTVHETKWEKTYSFDEPVFIPVIPASDEWISLLNQYNDLWILIPRTYHPDCYEAIRQFDISGNPDFGGEPVRPPLTFVMLPEPPPPEPLTDEEQLSLMAEVQRCWNIGILSAAATRTMVVVEVSMDKDAHPIYDSIKLMDHSGGNQQAVKQAFDAARQAIMRCGMTGYNLPNEKYQHWRKMKLTFDPKISERIS